MGLRACLSRDEERFCLDTDWGHGSFKDFVRDYFKQVQARAAAAGNTNV